MVCCAVFSVASLAAQYRQIPIRITNWPDPVVSDEEQKTRDSQRDEWERHPVVPPPYKQPHPTMALWHTYNEEPGVEDVYDWSRHGNIGEFNTADAMFNDVPGFYNNALRFYGKRRDGKSSGYFIMPSDTLTLARGVVSFWICIDGSDPKNATGVILTANRKSIAVTSASATDAKIEVSFGGRITAKDVPVNEWFFFAWQFDGQRQRIFINDKKSTESAGGASFDGSAGVYVGKNNSDKGGFAGGLDELMIQTTTAEPMLGYSLSPAKGAPALGLLFKCDYNLDPPTDQSPLQIKIEHKNLSGIEAGRLMSAFKTVNEIVARINAIDKEKKDAANEAKKKELDEKRNKEIENYFKILPKFEPFEFGTDDFKGRLQRSQWLEAEAGTLKFRLKPPPKDTMKDSPLIPIISTSWLPEADGQPQYMYVMIKAPGKDGNPNDPIRLVPNFSPYVGSPCNGIEVDFPLKPGEWHDIIIAWNATANQNQQPYFEVWINGKKTGRYTGLFRFWNRYSPITFWFRRPPDKTVAVNGQIEVDDVSIYNFFMSDRKSVV